MKLRIRTIENGEYVRAKRLWAECFPEDDGEFIEYYFANRTSPDNIIGAFDGDGKMLGGLHIIGQKLRICGTEKRIGFIAGVGTKPEHRNRGIASKLLEAAVPVMRDRGYAAAVLQPFNDDFYKKYGYRDFVFAGRCKSVAPTEHKNENYDEKSLLSKYNAFMAGYDGYAVRDEGTYTNLIKEFSANNAKIFSLGDSYALVYAGSGVEPAQVMEFVGNGDASALASVIRGSFGDVDMLVPTDSPLCEPGSISVFNQILPIDEQKLTDGTGFLNADSLIKHINLHGFALDRY